MMLVHKNVFRVESRKGADERVQLYKYYNESDKMDGQQGTARLLIKS
jgi:hypothetical protein